MMLPIDGPMVMNTDPGGVCCPIHCAASRPPAKSCSSISVENGPVVRSAPLDTSVAALIVSTVERAGVRRVSSIADDDRRLNRASSVWLAQWASATADLAIATAATGASTTMYGNSLVGQ